MKIIIIPNEPNPNMTGRHYGLAKALRARGHEVHTVMWDLPQQMSRRALIKHLFTSLHRRTYLYENLTLHHFGRLPLFWPVVNGWLFKAQLRRLHKQLGADMIFAMSYTNETRIPKNLPYIYDLADDYAAFADAYGSILYKIAFKVLGVRRTMQQQCRDALAVTAVSDILCGFARQFNSNVTMLPNGVEADIIGTLTAKATKQRTAKPKPHSLIYVSGFGPWSQPIKVMQAVMRLRKKFPDLTLTLVGEGSEVHTMRRFIADNNAASFIDYRGFIHDRAEVFRLIQQHAIGLNISDKNTWRDAAHPMKVIDYSALGKKVVSTDLEGAKALKLPNVFLFSDSGGSDSLQRAMQNALSNPMLSYPDVSKRIRAAYDWAAIADKLTSIFTDAPKTDRRLNIIHVTPSYPPALGGLEKVVQTLATTQAKAGIHASVITSKNTPLAGTHRDKIPVTRLRSFVLANTTIIPGLLPQLLRLPKTSVIHLHITQAFTPEMVWLASKIRSFRYIAHIHLDIPPSGAAGFLLKPYKSLVLRRVLLAANNVVVFTRGQRKEMHARYGLPLDRITVIPNGADDSYYYDKPRKLHAKPRLLFVGRLGYQKNLPMFLRALDGVSHRFQTTLVGDGELGAELRSLSQELHLKNIVFTGRADGSDLRQYYEQSDVFVLPSEREGMPLVLLDAMAMGLPIVATDVTGSRDVVKNGKNGLLTPYGDTEAFRDALLKLCFKPGLYRRLQHDARQMADNYSWGKLIHRFDPLYKESHETV